MDIGDFAVMRGNEALRKEREYMPIEPVDSAHGPDWHRVWCVVHDWETDGTESVLEEARDDHIMRDHLIGRVLESINCMAAGYRKNPTGEVRQALCLTASRWSNHPDYDAAWRVSRGHR